MASVMTFSDVLTPMSETPPFLDSKSASSLLTSKGNTEQDPQAIINVLQDQILATRKAWRLQLWELEAQLRELRTELDEVKGERCHSCGSAREDAAHAHGHSSGAAAGVSVVDRPRVKTGGGARAMFGSGWGGD